MVFRARQTYDDVQLARMEDPLPDGPWDLVISVLSLSDLTDEPNSRPLPPRSRALARSCSSPRADVLSSDRAEPGQHLLDLDPARS